MRRVLLLILLCAAFTSVRQGGGVRASSNGENIMLFGPAGDKLLEYCADVGSLKVGETVPPSRLADAAQHVGLCAGYIAGVNDAAIGYGSERNSMKRLYCVPRTAEMDQMIRVVTKSLEENPSRLHLPSSILVVDALRNAFPCK